MLYFHLFRTPSKDIPHTSTVDQSSDSSTDRASSPDAPVDLITTAVPEDVLLTDTTGIDSGDLDPQEPDSQRALRYPHWSYSTRTIHSKYG